MQIRRCKQIGILLKAEIGRIIQTRLNDPLIGFITVTDVEVARDMKYAKVFISVLGDDEKEQNAIKGLDRARPFIQKELSQVVRLRYIPILSFHLDISWKTSARVDELLHQIEQEEEGHLDSNENEKE
ncbi:30S ribosome-binding factor RbfA [candidate division KSB1 bacterium]|nr:30S ribosome-binding factor RbfA [candidate division KSB1 bacterium]